jgi:hypothetical protein
MTANNSVGKDTVFLRQKSLEREISAFFQTDPPHELFLKGSFWRLWRQVSKAAPRHPVTVICHMLFLAIRSTRREKKKTNQRRSRLPVRDVV